MPHVLKISSSYYDLIRGLGSAPPLPPDEFKIEGDIDSEGNGYGKITFLKEVENHYIYGTIPAGTYMQGKFANGILVDGTAEMNGILKRVYYVDSKFDIDSSFFQAEGFWVTSILKGFVYLNGYVEDEGFVMSCEGIFTFDQSKGIEIKGKITFDGFVHEGTFTIEKSNIVGLNGQTKVICPNKFIYEGMFKDFVAVGQFKVTDLEGTVTYVDASEVNLLYEQQSEKNSITFEAMIQEAQTRWNVADKDTEKNEEDYEKKFREILENEDLANFEKLKEHIAASREKYRKMDDKHKKGKLKLRLLSWVLLILLLVAILGIFFIPIIIKWFTN